MDSPEIERLRAALLTIREQYGHVCEEFDACNHPACRDSYSAWHVANEALCETGEGERLRAENAALRRWLRLVVQAWRVERQNANTIGRQLTAEWDGAISALATAAADSLECVTAITFKEGVKGHPYFLGKLTVLRHLSELVEDDKRRFGGEG